MTFYILKIHIGCWNSSQEIVNYMYEHGLGRETKDFLQLWAEFHVSYFVFFNYPSFIGTFLYTQQASLRVWDEEKGQDVNSRRDKLVTPKKVIIFSSHLTDPEHIESFLQKDR